MPYQVERETYATAPIFLWQSPRAEPVNRHAVMREFYKRYEQDFYEAEIRTAWGLITTKLAFAIEFLAFYFGPALLLPLLMFLRAIRDRRVRFLVAAGAVVLIGLAVEVFFIPHYAAPLTASILRWSSRLCATCACGDGPAARPGCFWFESCPWSTPAR